MKLPGALAVLLQAAFNRYLALDPDSGARIEKLQGKLVCMEFSAIDLQAWLLFHPDRVEVLEHYEAEPDTTISGAPFTMMALATGSTDIFSADVQITGDIDCARRFSQILERLDIDWEEHLSTLTGDTVARKIGLLHASVGSWLHRSRDSMQSNIADYLRDETDHLPYDWELDEFTDAVDDLRDRTVKLEARIKLFVDKG